MATATENTGPAHLVEAATGFPLPPVGLEVVNGHTLVHFTGKEAAGNGTYAYGVGMFTAPPGEYHRIAVWTLILKPSGEWVVESGDYCRTIGEALAIYGARGGSE